MSNFQWQVGGCGCACGIPVDLIFLIDVTGSMGGVNSSLMNSIRSFVRKCITSSKVGDWRAKMIGFGDITSDKSLWFQNTEFVQKYADFDKNLKTIKGVSGGDVNENTLDAIYRAVNLDVSETGESAKLWRPLHKAVRVLILITDAGYHSPLFIPEAEGGTINDVIQLIKEKRVVVAYNAPFDSFSTVGGPVTKEMPSFFDETIELARNFYESGGYPNDVQTSN